MAAAFEGSPAPPKPPGRRLYVLAAIVALVGLLVGGVLAWWVQETYPAIDEEIASGETETVQLEDDGMTVYVDRQLLDGGCDATDPDGAVIGLDQLLTAESYTIDDQQWQAVFRTTGPTEAREYTVECFSDGSVVFGIGPYANVYDADELVVIAAAVAGVGVVLAALMTIVVAVRRRRHHERWSATEEPVTYPATDPDGPPGATAR